MARQTSDGLESNIILEATLNVDTVSQDIQPFDAPAPHIANNGIIKDGGITELYETAVTQTNATYCYPMSNGNILKLNSLGSSTFAAAVYVYDGTSDHYIGLTSNVFIQRQVVASSYLDVILSSDGTHGLGLRSSSTGIYLDEFSLSTQAVTQTALLIGTSTFLNGKTVGLAFVQAPTLTFANVQTTTGILALLSNNTNAYYVVNSTAYAISNTHLTFSNAAQWDNLRGYYNPSSATVYACVPDSGTIGKVMSAVSPFASWTEITYLGLSGITVGYTFSDDTIGSITVTTSDQTTPVFVLNTSTGVASSAAGSLYPSVANFKMESGIVTPWGCAGIYSTSGAAPFGTFISSVSFANSPNTTKPIQNPEIQASANGVSFFGSGAAIVPGLVSINGTISNISMIQSSSAFQGAGAFVNDFGGGQFGTDIMAGNTFKAASVGQLFWSPHWRAETATGNGCWLVYKTNNRSFVLVAFYYNANQNPQEISSGVVVLNNCVSTNNIVDGIAFKGYINTSFVTNPFMFNYTDSTSLVYIRQQNQYSASMISGLLYGDYTTVKPNGVGYFPGSFAAYDGSSGAYISSIGSAGNVFYDSAQAGTYVAPIYVAPSPASVISGGGIRMLTTSAVQEPSFFGYQIANLFSVKYNAFFILKGSWYCSDGNNIYRIPLSNGPGSSVSGPNLIVSSAPGLTYLTVSQDAAYFLSSFDNSIWIFDGGQTVTKQIALNQESAVQSGVYNTHDNSLTLITSSNVLTLRDESYFSSNALPWSPSTSFSVYNTSAGVYFVQGNVTKIRTYTNLVPGTSVIIPLSWQSAYFGPGISQSASPISTGGTAMDAGIGKGQTWTCNYVKVRLYFGSLTASLVTLTWNYISIDGTTSGQNTATVTPTASSAGYVYIQWTPPNSAVMGASLGISTADTTQKIVLLDVLVYYNPDSEAVSSFAAS